MNVIFYASVTDERTKELFSGLEKTNRRIGLEIHRSFVSLKRRLMQPMNGIGLVILYASSEEDLTGLMALKERLRDFPVIFIMANTEGDAMKIGRILRPRFIFGPDDNPGEVEMIYKQMIARISCEGRVWLKENRTDRTGYLHGRTTGKACDS